MPNKIKFSPTGTETDSIFTNNLAIKVSEANTGGGPSATTGFYNGPLIPIGGYVAYNGSTAFVANNDAELVDYVNSLGAGVLTVGEALIWADGNGMTIVDKDYENMIVDGQVLNLDAGFSGSYPGANSSWRDLSGNNPIAVIQNTPAFSNGGLQFDGTNDKVVVTSNATELAAWNSNWQNSNQMTVVAFGVFNFDGFVSTRSGIIGQRYYYDLGFSFHLHCNPNNDKKKLAFNIGSNGNFRTSGHSYTDIEALNGVPCMVSVRHDGTTKQVRFGLNTNYNDQYLPSALTVAQYMVDQTNHVSLIRYDSAGGSAVTQLFGLQVYNRFLSDEEMFLNYQALSKRYTPLTVQYLVVAGGGGGGGFKGGGGGAGGLLTGSDASLNMNIPYNILIGAGGAANANGSNSVFNNITALGGGSGSNSGGSGGGANGAHGGNGYGRLGGTGTPGQGNDGGATFDGITPTNNSGGGGGGGAGAIGNHAIETAGGDGGEGLYIAEYSTLGGYPAGWFAGGAGGGAPYNSNRGLGSNGGGGRGAANLRDVPNAEEGVINTGGGGGGGSSGGFASGYSFPVGGGSGIVILRVPDAYKAQFSNGVEWSETRMNGYIYYKVTATSTTAETVNFT